MTHLVLLRFHLIASTEPAISLVLHPHHSSAYSLPINGGLPLSRGIQSYLSRHRIVYLSAVILVIALVMQTFEEKPQRQSDGRPGSSSGSDSSAQQHWQQTVKAADDTMLGSMFKPSDTAEKK